MFQRIANYFSRHNAVRKVADDPALAAELLLLIQILFADGKRGAGETQAFVKIASQQFGLSPDVLPDVIKYLRDFGYETSMGQAASLFGEMAPERRLSLIENLMTIASADRKVEDEEVDMIKRIAAILGVTPEEIIASRRAASL